jgi:hypothetical protein
VVDFLELSGMELVHTLRRENVPDGMIYMFANKKKIGAREAFVSRDQIGLTAQIPDNNFYRFCLTQPIWKYHNFLDVIT